MPIHCPITIDSPSADEFAKLDYRVMGHAYASQNELGRFCDECVYEADLRARLLSDGFHSVHTQLPVTVTHQSFSKIFRIDLIADGAPYELKTAAALTDEHHAQLLNYIFLLGLRRGKLLNFRPRKIQGQIAVTSLTHKERRRFTVLDERWQNLTPGCTRLRQTIFDLHEDWGAFLGLELYQEALVHLLGGPATIERRVGLNRNGLELGSQRMLVHAADVAFRVTAFTESQSHVEPHLRRMLALTDLEAIQWINLNHARIELTTIAKSARE